MVRGSPLEHQDELAQNFSIKRSTPGRRSDSTPVRRKQTRIENGEEDANEEEGQRSDKQQKINEENAIMADEDKMHEMKTLLLRAKGMDALREKDKIFEIFSKTL